MDGVMAFRERRGGNTRAWFTGVTGRVFCLKKRREERGLQSSILTPSVVWKRSCLPPIRTCFAVVRPSIVLSLPLIRQPLEFTKPTRHIRQPDLTKGERVAVPVRLTPSPPLTRVTVVALLRCAGPGKSRGAAAVLIPEGNRRSTGKHLGFPK